jgi:multiple sugar transport system permease protein
MAAVFFNGLLAYAVSVVKPRGYKVVYALVMLSFMIPTVANLVPLFKEISDFGLINSYLPLCLAAGANAFYFLLFKTYFDSLPQDLFEAARVDGAGDLRIFFSIIVPLSRPIIGVVSIFAMTAAWSDFLLPYLVLQDDGMQTIMVKIYSIQSTIATSTEFGPDRLLMLLCLSIIPQIIFFAFFQKQITATSTTSGIKE